MSRNTQFHWIRTEIHMHFYHFVRSVLHDYNQHHQTFDIVRFKPIFYESNHYKYVINVIRLGHDNSQVSWYASSTKMATGKYAFIELIAAVIIVALA